MPADTLGLGLAFVLVLGLLLAACLGLAVVLVVLLGVRVHAVGTLLGVPLAVLASGGTYLVVSDGSLGVLAAVSGLLLGVALGRWQWPDADPPAFVEGAAYRVSLLAVGGAAVGAGVGVWIVLVGTAGPTLALELFADHPRDFVALLAVTSLPIGGGVTALATIHSVRRRDSRTADEPDV